MIRLILARHGNTFEEGQTPVQIGKIDLPLTERGRQQAAAIQLPPVNAIYSGSLKRQREFAEIVARGFPVQEELALNEIDYGPWEGLTAEEIAKGWPIEVAAWNQSAIWPEGRYRSNLNRWLDYLRDTFRPGSLIFAVTSGGILRLIYPQKVSTGHLCELELFPHHFSIKSWNTNPQVATLRT